MSSKQFTAKIFQSIHQVNADGWLPHSAAKTAIALVDYFNEGEGGMAWPSCRTIADDSALSEHTVIRSVRLLGERGHLRIAWGKQGRGHPNRYWMIENSDQRDLFEERKPQRAEVLEEIKPAPAQVLDPQRKPAISSRKPAISSRKPAPVQEIFSKNHLRTTEEEKRIRTARSFFSEFKKERGHPKEASKREGTQPKTRDRACGEIRGVLGGLPPAGGQGGGPQGVRGRGQRRHRSRCNHCWGEAVCARRADTHPARGGSEIHRTWGDVVAGSAVGGPAA